MLLLPFLKLQVTCLLTKCQLIRSLLVLPLLMGVPGLHSLEKTRVPPVVSSGFTICAPASMRDLPRQPSDL